MPLETSANQNNHYWARLLVSLGFSLPTFLFVTLVSGPLSYELIRRAFYPAETPKEYILQTGCAAIIFGIIAGASVGKSLIELALPKPKPINPPDPQIEQLQNFLNR